MTLLTSALRILVGLGSAGDRSVAYAKTQILLDSGRFRAKFIRLKQTTNFLSKNNI